MAWKPRNVKLTPGEVSEIRQRHADGETQLSIALDYGVSQTQVWRIVTGKAWGGMEQICGGRDEGSDSQHQA